MHWRALWGLDLRMHTHKWASAAGQTMGFTGRPGNSLCRCHTTGVPWRARQLQQGQTGCCYGSEDIFCFRDSLKLCTAEKLKFAALPSSACSLFQSEGQKEWRPSLASLTWSSWEVIMRQPQAKLGCWCMATCSRRLTKAQTRALLMSACIALNSRLRNMAALFVCATSPDASTAYSALQHTRPSLRLKVRAALAAAH